MDQLTAKKHFQEFLEKHLDSKPSKSCVFSELEKYINDGIEFYFCIELDENTKKPSRGAKSYYIFPDGSVLMPYGGSSNPEESESIVRRWKNKEY